MKYLVNISGTTPTDEMLGPNDVAWKGFELVNIFLPDVPPEYSALAVSQVAGGICMIIDDKLDEVKKKDKEAKFYLLIAGELTICYILRDLLGKDYTFAVPIFKKN